MRSLVLLSGGIDSAVCLAALRGQYREAIAFDYGQRHVIELLYAQDFAEAEGVRFQKIRLPNLPLVNDVVFGGRNAVMLSVAAAYAQKKELDRIVIGCNREDAIRFPDCKPEFMASMDWALTAAYGVGVSAPLINHQKLKILEDADHLGISLNPFWTCYEPKDNPEAPHVGIPCGKCVACKSLWLAQAAKKAFA